MPFYPPQYPATLSLLPFSLRISLCLSLQHLPPPHKSKTTKRKIFFTNCWEAEIEASTHRSSKKPIAKNMASLNHFLCFSLFSFFLLSGLADSSSTFLSSIILFPFNFKRNRSLLFELYSLLFGFRFVFAWCCRWNTWVSWIHWPCSPSDEKMYYYSSCDLSIFFFSFHFWWYNNAT